MEDRLNFLKRFNIGRQRIDYYRSLFNDFEIIEFIDLKSSDSILINNPLNNEREYFEFIESSENFLKSELLRNIYFSLSTNSKSYIFTDDYEYCGMFLVNTKEAIEKSTEIAKKDINNTVFILDFKKEFFIRINYYDESHSDYSLKYDIKVIKKNMFNI